MITRDCDLPSTITTAVSYSAWKPYQIEIPNEGPAKKVGARFPLLHRIA